jgi:hypothetical protein
VGWHGTDRLQRHRRDGAAGTADRKIISYSMHGCRTESEHDSLCLPPSSPSTSSKPCRPVVPH